MYNNVTLCTLSDWFISFKRVRVTLYSAIDDCPIIKMLQTDKKISLQNVKSKEDNHSPYYCNTTLFHNTRYDFTHP